jgi:hypothetical protein
MTLPETKPARTELQTVRAMLNACRLALPVILSFLFTTLSDPLLGDVLGALETLARATGCLTAHVTRYLPLPPRPHPTRRGHTRRIATLFIYVTPLRLNWDSRSFGGSWRSWRCTTAASTLSRNLGCLKCFRTLVAAALFLAGTLGSSWFVVPGAVPNADYVLATRGTAPGSAPLGTGAVAGMLSKRGGKQIGGLVE